MINKLEHFLDEWGIPALIGTGIVAAIYIGVALAVITAVKINKPEEIDNFTLKKVVYDEVTITDDADVLRGIKKEYEFRCKHVSVIVRRGNNEWVITCQE